MIQTKIPQSCILQMEKLKLNKIKVMLYNIIWFIKEEQELRTGEEIFKGGFGAKFFLCIICIPITILFFFAPARTLIEFLFIRGMGFILFLLFFTETFGHHIVLKEDKILQRTYFFLVRELDIKDIKSCKIQLGVDRLEKRSSVSLRIQATKKEFIILNCFYYKREDLEKIATFLGFSGAVSNSILTKKININWKKPKFLKINRLKKKKCKKNNNI